MGILLKVPSGAICTLSLSFNNDGPLGSFFRYICDNGTYNAYYDDLVDGKKNPIDLFQYQAGENISDCYAVQGPIHPQLNIAMDMGIVAKTPSGSILNLSLSFNNDGPLGSFFRYICDNGTYKAFYDDQIGRAHV